MSCKTKIPLCILLAGLLVMPVCAAQTDCDETYCFSLSDFAEETSEFLGICVTGIPEEAQGTILLGSRVIRTGDVLTCSQLNLLTFQPVQSEEDDAAVISYLPVFSGGLGAQTETVISIHGKRDDPPVAEDSAMETYKNLPNEGQLKVSDPEGQPMTYALVKAPKRGEVVIREDGSFLYTPKNNKVGTDSFTFTATDPAGNVSREATVTVKILKPTDSALYTDTVGLDCRFEAEWLKNTGIFSGETISGKNCFSPGEAVTRGEFLAMLMDTLELPVASSVTVTGFSDDCADWLKPYLAAAYKAGIISGYPVDNGVEFRPDQAITGEEAVSMVESALTYALPICAEETAALDDVACSASLTRSDTARMLYQVSKFQGDSLTSLFGG